MTADSALCRPSLFIISVVYGIGAHKGTQGLRSQDIAVAIRTSCVSIRLAVIAIVIEKLPIIAFLDQIRDRHKGRPGFLLVYWRVQHRRHYHNNHHYRFAMLASREDMGRPCCR
jgi:hypothetical protein